MQPIDYVSGFGPPPAAGFASAMEAGQRFGIMEQQQAAAREKQQMLMQQQQAASLRQQMIEQARQKALGPSATINDWTQWASMYDDPKQNEMVRQTWEARTKAQQQQELDFLRKYGASLFTGSPEIAAKFAKERAEGYRNRGEETDADALDALANIATVDQNAAKLAVAKWATTLPGGKELIEAWKTVREEGRQEELQPSAVKKAASEAESAAVAAKFAESKAVAELALSEARINGLASDEQIKRQNVAIAAMNARTAAEGNALKRQELQQRLDELQSKRDSTIREKNADLEAARGNIDNMLNTADRVINTPMSVVGSAAGPISARIPTMAQSTADFESLVETLGSQSFLAQIPNIKGMGQLSNAEGEKLQAALQNFSLKQSPEQLMRNVREAQRLLLKARQNIEARYGAAPSVPDTPAARSAAPRPGTQTPQSVDELVRRYGGGG
jgi:hypothetical protein